MSPREHSRVLPDSPHLRHQLRQLRERLRDSLFVLPAIFTVLSLGLARATLRIDERHAEALQDLPVLLHPSAAGARTLLTTIAGATITVAGIVFSVTLVALQLAASQFSPRLLRGFLRDRFGQVVIGVVISTFVYSLVVLAGVRRGVGEGVEAPVARLSVTVALVLAVIAVLANVAFIDRSARSIQVSQIVQRIARETRERIGDIFPYMAGEAPKGTLLETPLPRGESYTVRSTRHGWVQRIDERSLAAAVEEGSAIRVDVRIGTFVVDRTPLCKVWPNPADGEVTAARARRAFVVGSQRTMWEDVTFGLLQLVDIALRALSPGINDPATAHEALGSIGGVLSDLLHRDLPPRVRDVDSRRIYRPHDLGPTAYIDLAFEDVRVACATQPAVCVALLSTLARLHEKLQASGLEHRTAALRHQAELVVISASEACVVAEDRDRVRAAAEDLGLVPTS